MRIRTGRREWIILAGLLAAYCFAGVASAESPFRKLIPFKSVDADPRKSYWLTEDQGPWLIFAASFAGEGAEQDAHELVLELRKKFKMEAYMHKRHFDFSGTVQGRGVDRYGAPRKMRYRNGKSFDEIAVLVGNFTNHDAPGADEDLVKIKTVNPSSLGGKKDGETTQRFTVLRELQQIVHLDPEKKLAGPMRKAFIARNPLLPKEFFVGTGLAPFVLNMNRGVKHSLLNCRGKYTVRVASFRGKSHFVGDEDEKKKGRSLIPTLPKRKPAHALEIAADKAHRLTEMLRDKGIEAYEFHDRCESIVTIGSFASVGDRLADGRINLHPEIHRIMESYGGERLPLPGQANGVRPRELDEFKFDVQPLPVEVPRRSIASDYAAGAARMR